MKLNFKLLIYDIETSFLKANIWRLGENHVRHDQLDPAFSMYEILTISYKWYGDRKIITLKGSKAIELFDKEVRKADVVIGKNNINFDNKHINTQRLLQGQKPLPEWAISSDDLEKQIRKYFIFPSYSLDYVSKLFGFGGKMKMEFKDWVDISNLELLTKFKLNSLSTTIKQRDAFCVTMFHKKSKEIERLGKKAWDKMIYYNKKDVKDTENVLNKVLPYIKLKYNAATKQEGFGCIACGSRNLVPTTAIVDGKTKYQLWECLDHNGYGGRCTWYYKKGSHNKTYGKMG